MTFGTSAWQLAPAKTELAAGGFTVGGVSSTMVIVCVSVATLPAASVAFHVIVVGPTGKKFPAGTPRRTILTVQLLLSLTTASPKSASLRIKPHAPPPAPVESDLSAGASIVGAVVSFRLTVTVWVQESLRPLASDAVQMTVVVPTANGSVSSFPSLRSIATVTGEVPPVVVGATRLTCASQPVLIVVVTFAAQVMAGAASPATLIVKLQAPPPVADVEVTSVAPTGKKDPEA